MFRTSDMGITQTGEEYEEVGEVTNDDGEGMGGEVGVDDTCWSVNGGFNELCSSGVDPACCDRGHCHELSQN